jgi:hypothetical protein
MYVKAELADGVEIKVELTADNIYDYCGACHRETTVSWEEIAEWFLNHEEDDAEKILEHPWHSDYGCDIDEP